MSACQRHYEDDPTASPCTLNAGHLYGCVFAGRSVGDGHDISEQAAEDLR